MSTALWWMGQNALTIAILVPVVALICRRFRNQPAVQHLLWVVVLVKFLTPSLVTWPWSMEQMRGSLLRSSSEDSRSPSFLPEGPPAARQMPIDLSSTPASDSAMRSIASTHVDPVILTGLGLTGLWLMGAAICITRQLRRIKRHVSLVRQATSAPAHLTREIAAAAKQLGVRPLRAMLAQGIGSPFVWCLGRLRLIWPEALSSQEEIVRARGALAHELAHVRRRDHWFAWLVLVAEAIWWWYPLFWLVRRRLRETAEMACDALAISAFPERRCEYAELLLELSAGCKVGAPAPVLAVSAGTPSSFERRLSMILSERVSGKMSAWGILAGLGLALVALPGWSLGQQQKPKQSSSTDTGVSWLFDEAVPQQWKAVAEDQLSPSCLEGIHRDKNLTRKLCSSCHEPVQPMRWKVELVDDNPAERMKKLDQEIQRLQKQLKELRDAMDKKSSSELKHELQDKAKESASQSFFRWTKDRTDVEELKNAELADYQRALADKVRLSRLGENVLHPLDLGERYLKAVADLKLAKGRVTRMQNEGNAVSQIDLDEARIELERAEKREQLVSTYIKDALRSAQAALAVGQEEYKRSILLEKKGFLAKSQLEAAKASMEEAEARVKQLGAILSVAK